MLRIPKRFDRRQYDRTMPKRVNHRRGACSTRCCHHIRHGIGAILLFLLMSAMAQAGPWPRGKGKVFLSVGGQTEISSIDGLARNYATLYGEYGLSEKLTLGLDAGGYDLNPEKVVLFLRHPVFEGDRKMLYAAELGVGLVESQMAIRPGFTLGRGLTIGEKSGWMTLDTRAVFFAGGHDPMIEADFTVGYAPTERVKLIGQFQTGMTFGQSPYLKFVPSLVYEKKPGQHLEFGLIAGIKDDTAYGFKIAFWRSF